MVFWLIVGVVVVLVLALCWRADRRSRRRLSTGAGSRSHLNDGDAGTQAMYQSQTPPGSGPTPGAPM